MAGRWRCVWTLGRYLKTPKPGLIEWFDSYGYRPDTELDFISPEMKIESKQFGQLTKLIKNAPGVTVYYNQKQLQERGNAKMDTCGRWCLARVTERNKTLAEFQRYFVEGSKELGLMPDQLVTLVTFPLLPRTAQLSHPVA